MGNFSGSQFGQGAAGGFLAGGPVGAVAGGLLGGFGSKKAVPGRIETEFFKNPTFGFVDRLLPKQAQFLEGNLERLQSDNPTSQQFQNLEPILREGLQRDTREKFFGRPGERGGSILDEQRSLGASLGVGPKATQANVTKSLRDFSRERQQIEEFIANLQFQDVTNERNQLQGNINSLDRGPQGQFFQTVIPGSPGSQLGSQLFGLGIAGGKNSPFDFGGGGGGGGFSLGNLFKGSGGVGINGATQQTIGQSIGGFGQSGATPSLDAILSGGF